MLLNTKKQIGGSNCIYCNSSGNCYSWCIKRDKEDFECTDRYVKCKKCNTFRHVGDTAVNMKDLYKHKYFCVKRNPEFENTYIQNLSRKTDLISLEINSKNAEILDQRLNTSDLLLNSLFKDSIENDSNKKEEYKCYLCKGEYTLGNEEVRKSKFSLRRIVALQCCQNKYFIDGSNDMEQLQTHSKKLSEENTPANLDPKDLIRYHYDCLFDKLTRKSLIGFDTFGEIQEMNSSEHHGDMPYKKDVTCSVCKVQEQLVERTEEAHGIRELLYNVQYRITDSDIRFIEDIDQNFINKTYDEKYEDKPKCLLCNEEFTSILDYQLEYIQEVISMCDNERFRCVETNGPYKIQKNCSEDCEDSNGELSLFGHHRDCDNYDLTALKPEDDLYCLLRNLFFKIDLLSSNIDKDHIMDREYSTLELVDKIMDIKKHKPEYKTNKIEALIAKVNEICIEDGYGDRGLWRPAGQLGADTSQPAELTRKISECKAESKKLLEGLINAILDKNSELPICVPGNNIYFSKKTFSSCYNKLFHIFNTFPKDIQTLLSTKYRLYDYSAARRDFNKKYELLYINNLDFFNENFINIKKEIEDTVVILPCHCYFDEYHKCKNNIPKGSEDNASPSVATTDEEVEDTFERRIQKFWSFYYFNKLNLFDKIDFPENDDGYSDNDDILKKFKASHTVTVDDLFNGFKIETRADVNDDDFNKLLELFIQDIGAGEKNALAKREEYRLKRITKAANGKVSHRDSTPFLEDWKTINYNGNKNVAGYIPPQLDPEFRYLFKREKGTGIEQCPKCKEKIHFDKIITLPFSEFKYMLTKPIFKYDGTPLEYDIKERIKFLLNEKNENLFADHDRASKIEVNLTGISQEIQQYVKPFLELPSRHQAQMAMLKNLKNYG